MAKAGKTTQFYIVTFRHGFWKRNCVKCRFLINYQAVNRSSRAEIKDVMSYLRLIINPEDDSAFLRIINTPKRAIGPVTLENLACLRRKTPCHCC